MAGDSPAGQPKPRPSEIRKAAKELRERQGRLGYNDTYSVLEFQGYVSEVPEYESAGKRLRFYARALGKPSLRFVALGDDAKAYKEVLRFGQLIRVQATPMADEVEMRGRPYRSIEWKVLTISLMGLKKVRLSTYADRRILEGLMPLEHSFMDVGAVPKEKQLLLERQALGEGEGGDGRGDR